MFALAWQYLSGRAVATHPTDRQEAEWPPHPDRAFQALVAAWGETGATDSGKAALAWLEQQGVPQLVAPRESDPESPVSATTTVKVYVPVNDVNGPSRGEYGDKKLSLMPSSRFRKDRCFPSMVVGDAMCALIWPAANPSPDTNAKIADLASAVTSIGHSRSLVRMWVCENPPAPTWLPVETHSHQRAIQLRVPDPGRLDALVHAYAAGGKDWTRPPMARWQRYANAVQDRSIPSGVFDARLVVLRIVCRECRLTLAQTLAFTEGLRGSLIKQAEGIARQLVSGHEPDGAILQTPHIAYIPLPHVGDEHADGHLLGFALALPKELEPVAEDEIFAALAKAIDAETATIRLVTGPAGACDVVIEDRPTPPKALQAAVWCGPSKYWGTVTPIVLDRLPPRRHTDTDDWTVQQITAACLRQGLPEPSAIQVLTVSPHIGAPSAHEFPPLRRKPDGARRWHVHARVAFPHDIGGPLILGAGRYRGYGLCKPLNKHEDPL